MKSARFIIHALDLDQVALSADAAGLYPPFDPAQPAKERKPIRELDPEGKRRYVRVLEFERHPDGTLVVEVSGEKALRWMQTICDADALAQRERQTARWTQKQADEKARIAAAALANAQLFAAALGGDATPGAVSVAMTPAMDGGQLVDVDLEDGEPLTPPASPAAKSKKVRHHK